jgi:hypothetical protein
VGSIRPAGHERVKKNVNGILKRMVGNVVSFFSARIGNESSETYVEYIYIYIVFRLREHHDTAIVKKEEEGTL